MARPPKQVPSGPSTRHEEKKRARRCSIPFTWRHLLCLNQLPVCVCAFLSGTDRNMPTHSVFSDRFYCCLISAHCVYQWGGGGMWGLFGKPMKRATWNTLGLHVVLTVCSKFLSFLDGACVACCLFLSTGSYHVRIQIHATCCCIPRCTAETFGSQKSTLWGCYLGAGLSPEEP